MESLKPLLEIYRSQSPTEAFQVLVDSLSPSLRLHCALWIAPDRGIRHAWPGDVEATTELIDAAFHIFQPEVFLLGSEFPTDAERYPGSEVLFLPLRASEGGDSLGVCLLIADRGQFGEDLEFWEASAEALRDCTARCDRLVTAEARGKELQERVEESEALHTLGLAANRTLNPEEVLRLVARFTRTLLGANYVTVNTASGERIYTVASVGVRNPEAAVDDYRLARTIVQAQKPVLVGAGGTVPVEEFAFHVGEGMRVGLGIPLSLFGEAFGSLIIGYRYDHAITPRDTRLALTLAGHAAVAISNARLHQKVEQRSRELEEAYEELGKLTQTKERFFASINHELRNPIGAVLGYLELVLDGTAGEVSAPAKNFLGKAHRSARTLKELVNDILDLSKIAAGKMEFELQPCSVADIVDGALNTIQPLAEQKGVPLVVEIGEDLPRLRTDAHRVQQILVNLLSNAVKFTQGDVRLHAEVRTSAGEQVDTHCVAIRVSDTGPGIRPEDQGLIFEEFEQVKGTKGGTGLGLPISRRLARLLGGDLSVQSELGVGSTFILQLPCAASAPAVATPAPAAQETVE